MTSNNDTKIEVDTNEIPNGHHVNGAFENDELPAHYGQNGLSNNLKSEKEQPVVKTYGLVNTDENDAESEDGGSACGRRIAMPIRAATKFIIDHKKIIHDIIIVILIIGYIAYMIAALVINFQRSFPLLVIFCIVLSFKIYGLFRYYYGEAIWKVWKPIYKAICRNMFWIKWVFISILIALFATWIALDTSKRPNQLISLAGYVIFVFCLFVSSKYPHRVRWRPVFWGLGIQIVLGLIILRTKAGFEAFNWLGEIAQTFLNFVNKGSSFVFGKNYTDFYFAFKVLLIIIYFSAFISVLYYLGAMQWLICKLAWLMQLSLGTSASESMCAAGNIFVGLTESPLLIRPYIKDITTSEMHAVMVAGFGTIAGSVLGAYLEFKIKPVYVITACVMAAPCALGVSKLIYPETKKSKFMSLSGLKLETTKQKNVIEAAFEGATLALPLVLNIAANIIAFLSLLAALNAGLGWFGGMLDYPQLSFELICSYVFLPITYMTGIEWQDCFKCAELLGTKIFLNEFIAYEELSRMIQNKQNGTFPRQNINGTVNWISDRSEAIITYALCGFANVGSLGIMLGGLGSLCPNRQSEMSKIIIRALMGGIFVSILNACVAGFLYLPPIPDCDRIFSYEFWNGTDLNNVYQCCTTMIISNSTSDDACRCCQFPWTDEFTNLTSCDQVLSCEY
ncbi:sodium/nucleoside cotransporter 2-like [Styela clava]